MIPPLRLANFWFPSVAPEGMKMSDEMKHEKREKKLEEGWGVSEFVEG